MAEPTWPRVDTARYESAIADNRLVGDSGWHIPATQRAAATQLALWASPYTATVGDSLDVFIHATYGPVELTLYRLGWYGGFGGRAVWSEKGVAAGTQPACTPPFPGPVECPWSRTIRIPTPAEGASGIYLLRAIDATGKAAFYPVVLRSPRPAAVAVVIPQFTWQAYNEYGGSGLYTSTATPGTLVHFASFERPYKSSGGAAELFDRTYSLELLVGRWLERNGYDVSYVSDADLADPARPLVAGARVFVFAGHDEYWTWGEFDRVRRLRDNGRHFMFLSGNNAYWNIRLSAGQSGCVNCVITCYKLSPDPAATSNIDVTTSFRRPPLNRPENSLIGIMYMHGSSSVGAPLVAGQPPSGSLGAGFLAQAGFSPGDSVPGLVGSEGDQIVDNGGTPSDLQVMFRSPAQAKDTAFGTIYYYTTFYRAPSGAGVFAAGSNDYARGLDGYWGSTESPKLQALTKGVLDWMLTH